MRVCIDTQHRRIPTYQHTYHAGHHYVGFHSIRQRAVCCSTKTGDVALEVHRWLHPMDAVRAVRGQHSNLTPSATAVDVVAFNISGFVFAGDERSVPQPPTSQRIGGVVHNVDVAIINPILPRRVLPPKRVCRVFPACEQVGGWLGQFTYASALKHEPCATRRGKETIKKHSEEGRAVGRKVIPLYLCQAEEPVPCCCTGDQEPRTQRVGLRLQA